MAKGYWIASGEVTDTEAYKKYIEANAAPLKEFGARFLVRGGEYESVAGTCGSRNVVLEFDSYEKALACYKSDAYQKAVEYRNLASDMNVTIIAGYDGPQPGDG